MLRLVHPAREGQGTRPPKGRRTGTLSLTLEEKQHLRAVLRNLRSAYGSWSCVAQVMGVSETTLHHAVLSRPQSSPALALAAARAAGMSVDAILSGQLSAAGRCSACGSRIGDKPERRVS